MDIRDSHTHIVIVVVDSHVPDASPDTALLYMCVLRVPSVCLVRCWLTRFLQLAHLDGPQAFPLARLRCLHLVAFVVRRSGTRTARHISVPHSFLDKSCLRKSLTERRLHSVCLTILRNGLISRRTRSGSTSRPRFSRAMASARSSATKFRTSFAVRPHVLCWVDLELKTPVNCGGM